MTNCLSAGWSFGVTRWCNRLDEARAKGVARYTIEAAKTLKAIRPREQRVVLIDTTAQEKNVGYPTARALLELVDFPVKRTV